MSFEMIYELKSCCYSQQYIVRKIAAVVPLSNYVLLVSFDDGKRVLYDMKDDFDLPEYIVLKDFEGLFSQVRLDRSRTCVYWNDYVDVPSDIIYEYGKPVSECGFGLILCSGGGIVEL